MQTQARLVYQAIGTAMFQALRLGGVRAPAWPGAGATAIRDVGRSAGSRWASGCLTGSAVWAPARRGGVICPASILGKTNPVGLDQRSAQRARLGSQRWTSEAQPNRASAGCPRPRRLADEEECLAQRRKDAEKRSRAACGCTPSPSLLFASLRLCASFSFLPRRHRGGRNDDQDHRCQWGNRPCAGDAASIRRGGAGRLRRDTARCGHGRIWAGTVAYGDRRTPQAPRVT